MARFHGLQSAGVRRLPPARKARGRWAAPRNSDKVPTRGSKITRHWNHRTTRRTFGQVMLYSCTFGHIMLYGDPPSVLRGGVLVRENGQGRPHYALRGGQVML